MIETPHIIKTTKKRSVFQLVNKIIFIFFLFLVSSSVTTQFLAHQLSYDPLLGEAVNGSLYWPWLWIVWSLDWWSTYTHVLQQGLTLFISVFSVFMIGFAIAMLLLSRQSKAISGLHGTAHWANEQEIKASGLMSQHKNKVHEGVYVGAWKNPKTGSTHYLRHDGPEHILSFAPTRSGKGVGLVLPTLLSWNGSVLCYDIKGENWALTAGWRQHHAGNKVMKFDPAETDGSSVAFNPLAEIRIGKPQEVGDAQNIATMLVDEDGKGLFDHWSKTSHALLTGAILHCCYQFKKEHNKVATLADVGALLANPEMPIEEVLTYMLEYEHLDGKPHPLVAQEARAMLNKDERELSSVLSSAISYLTLYRDPVVQKNTSHSDFCIRDLMNDDDPVSLYLVVRPSDATRLRPLIRLMMTQIVRSLTEKMEFEDGRSVAHYQHRLLLMIDEFASLKRLPVIEEALAFMAGYGLKAYLIVQDIQQITANYGREEGLMGNCHVRIAYAPNKIETAEVLSRMSGQTTVIRKQTTVSGKRFGYMLGQVSESMQEVQRPLLTADEAMRLPAAIKDTKDKIMKAGDMLIFVAGHAPIYGRQILYFQDPVFSARAKVQPPQVSDRIIKHSSVEQVALTEFALI